MRYIPDELFIDMRNRQKVFEILASVPDTCMRLPGMKTLEDAAEEIRGIGEVKIADFL